MFCGNCGNENVDGTRFCVNCGADMTKLTPPTTGHPVEDTGETDRTDADPNATLDAPSGAEARLVAPGRLLGGQYRITGTRPLGAGGMGEVWLAQDLELGTTVAIKVLPHMLCRDAAAVESLKREAKIGQQLTHRNICRLHGFHSDGDVRYIVMEYVDGRTLGQILSGSDGRRLAWSELEPIARGIADALDYAHGATYLDADGRRVRGVLHRDIKPQNIIVKPDGVAKLMDFGIAREIHNTMTMLTGRTSQTPLYASPEQFRGEPMTSASDVYSLAAVLYECLVGHPLISPHGDLSYQILNGPYEELESESADVNAALRAGLAKSPDERPARAGDLLAMACGEMEAAATRRWDATVADATQDERPRRGLRSRGRKKAVAVAAVVLLAAVAVGVWVWPGLFGTASGPPAADVTGGGAGVAPATRPLPRTRPVVAATGPAVAATKPATPAAGRPPERLKLDLDGETIELALISAGRFNMGSPLAEAGRDSREYLHAVEISPGKPGFYMGLREVTQAQYQALTGVSPSDFKGADRPVENVSWQDAAAFCKKLSEKTGRTVRLPTEAEWEYACRAGGGTRFAFGDGDGDLHKHGNYADSTSAFSWRDRSHSDGQSETAPVGSFAPNAWGLYDMHGNVMEWCADWHAEYAPGPATDPRGPPVGESRVVRGGSWFKGPSGCRSAARDKRPPGHRNFDIGFRVIVEAR